ncbi:MAG TPA: Ig domain-containing protein [Myxococcota bacterium]|nr:Ig domain-containing protein [Myxococcota bacterium]HRY93152.1 Ig domain-containing protein [Myxococcota bacterium]HSA23152.1 Ig domain-containing protein [Myxococcota bacterium]
MNELTPIALCLTLFASCASPVDNPLCTSNEDCAEGYRCDGAGACVPGGDLGILAPTLPRAYVGENYSVQLTVQGGLPPFAWRLETVEPALAWLTVDGATGELRNKAGQTPASEGADLLFTVYVRDSSMAGQGDEEGSELPLTVLGCRGDAFCYQPEGSGCREGLRRCVDGHLEESCQLSGWSISTDHCGPACGGCPPVVTDACYEGQCACGTSPPCAGNETCCLGVCADLSTSTTSCGACGHDCGADTQNVLAAHCAGSACDYDACQATHLDCDGDRQNGCETGRGMQDCAACEDACSDTLVYLNTVEPSCDLTACQYTCAPGFDSCDLDPGNGCETPLNTPGRCGGCGHDCAFDANGGACLPGAAAGEYACGCLSDGDCEPGELCCDSLCVPRDERHCADCATPCTIGTGGLFCTDQSGSWRCECASTEDCQGPYDWSQATCATGITDQCACGPVAVNCVGSPADICCYVGGDLACTSLYEDEFNCGRCGRMCSDGGQCVGGACGCPMGNCPSNSGGTFCIAGNCVCPAYDNVACPAGQYCCNNPGTAVGCCLMNCFTDANSGNRCSSTCGAPKVWCEAGCCDGCNPDTGCT